MNKNMDNLLKKFKKIASKGYIPGISNYPNSIGLTFEKELGKDADSLFFADFEGIEIKCKSRFSNYPIALFTIAFDGPYLFETNRILETYGKADSQIKDKKILITPLRINELNEYNNFNFKLEVNKQQKKIYLKVYDKDKNLIERKSYIEFESIKNKLLYKINLLAIVKASKKIINEKQYHRYYQINFYELKSFDTFIALLEKDIIKTTLLLRISRINETLGKQKNKNVVFEIDQNKIDLLFNELLSYNHDIKK